MEEQIFEIIRDIVSNNINTDFLHLKEFKTVYSVYYTNDLFCRINIKPKTQYLDFSAKHRSLFTEHKVTQIKSQPDYIRVHFNTLEDIEKMREALIIIAKSFPIPCTFDVCHRFEACSNAMKCLHPDQRHALECSYRQKLEHGIVFYGKNRNID